MKINCVKTVRSIKSIFNLKFNLFKFKTQLLNEILFVIASTVASLTFQSYSDNVVIMNYD